MPKTLLILSRVYREQSLIEFIGIVRLASNRMAFVCPVAEIYQPAAFAAKWA